MTVVVLTPYGEGVMMVGGTNSAKVVDMVVVRLSFGVAYLRRECTKLVKKEKPQSRVGHGNHFFNGGDDNGGDDHQRGLPQVQMEVHSNSVLPSTHPTTTTSTPNVLVRDEKTKVVDSTGNHPIVVMSTCGAQKTTKTTMSFRERCGDENDTAAGTDRVHAFLSSRSQKGSLTQTQQTTTRFINLVTFWDMGRRNLVKVDRISLGISLVAVLLFFCLTGGSFLVGYRFGYTAMELHNAYLQLAQVKFEEALSHFDRQLFAATGHKYTPDYDKLLTIKAGETVELFGRSLSSVGQLSHGNEVVQGLKTNLRSELLTRQLQLSAENALKGDKAASEVWEYDDKKVETAQDECRCRAVLLHRAGRQKITKTNGQVLYSDWADHGQVGQCMWME